MSETYTLENRIKAKKPYFGKTYFSWQGLPSRHVYMLAIIQLISKMKGNSFLNILEIGSWTGGSAITWAEGVYRYNAGQGRIFCVDPWELYFDPKDYDNDAWNVFHEMKAACSEDKHFSLFLHNVNASGFGNCIIPVRGKSKEVLPLLRNNIFDLIYVDGSHAYKEVLSDITMAIPLLADDGIICGDDLEFEFEECDIDSAKKNSHLEYAFDPKKNQFFHPGVTLALHEIFGKVSAWDGFWAMQMNNSKWHRIHLNVKEWRIPNHLYEAIEAGVVNGESINSIKVSNPIKNK